VYHVLIAEPRSLQEKGTILEVILKYMYAHTCPQSLVLTSFARGHKALDVLDIQGGPKKRGRRLMTIILSNLNRFKKNYWKISW